MSIKTMSLLLDIIKFVDASSKAATPKQKPTLKTKTTIPNHQKKRPKPKLTKQTKEEEELDSDCSSSSCSTHPSMPSLVTDPDEDMYYMRDLPMPEDWKREIDDLRDALGEN